MRALARWLVVVGLLLGVAGGWRARAEGPAPVAPPPAPDAASAAPAVESHEDPAVIRTAALAAAGRGEAALAETLLSVAYDKDERTIYFGKAKELRAATIAEDLGDFAAADAHYRALAKKDPLHAAIGLRVLSRSPERDAIFAEVVADVRARVARAKAGETVPIYVTTTGEERALQVIADRDVVDVLSRADANGEARLKYCYIENLDLTGVDTRQLAPKIVLDRCVVGRVHIPNRDVGAFAIKGFVLGDFQVGKTWDGEVNKGQAIPGSRFGELSTRETVFLGAANFQDVAISGRVARFPFTVFEQVADFRGARVASNADFRFSTFAEGANFKRARLSRAAYFGHTRFRAETRFTELGSVQTVYFDSAWFEAPVHFDACEFEHGATFENAEFGGGVSFDKSRVGGRLNLSRAVVAGPLMLKEVKLGGLDLFGADLRADTELADAEVTGKVRFALDGATRARHRGDPAPLLALYRDYQGDDDAAEPLAAQTSYGVRSVDDLTARIGGNLRFDNAVLTGFVIFEGVQFGRPGADTLAGFYNTQFGGETHFERTTWYSVADFSTIYAQELALNEAVFHATLLLDDANVPGRVTLTDASFGPGGTLSFYGAEIGTFQVDRSQVEGEGGAHRLWYARCADGDVAPSGDIRFQRQQLSREVSESAFVSACHDRAVDEYISLKQSFGDRAMADDEDWAYWWLKHRELVASVHDGGVGAWLLAPVQFLVFEQAFGWGVRLGNLAVTALLVCLVFAGLYRRFCPDTVMSYGGDDVAIRDIPWFGLLYISLQSLGGFNTGWDFGQTDMRFRYLNTAHTFTGVIILTFFVGAYTRMILA